MHLPSDVVPGCANKPALLDASAPTLAVFVQRNRDELIARCIKKTAGRDARAPVNASHGIPHFLDQLIDVLETEQDSGFGKGRAPPSAEPASKIGRTAAAHGAALLLQGFNVDQVVYQYGDICQAVTELAQALNTPFSTDEFRILNRSLDDAIAAAVSAHQSVAHQIKVEQQASHQHRLQMLIHDQQRLVGIARQSFLAIESGQVGVTGATGKLLAHALDELIQLSEERLPRVIDVMRKAAAQSPMKEGC